MNQQRTIFFASTALFVSFAALADCAPELRADALPTITPQASHRLVSHTEVFTVALPVEAFNARLADAPLSKLLPGTPKIAGVSGTRNLLETPFGTPGSPRVVCLVDGNSAVEEATENTPGTAFRYKVWNYTLDVAKPIKYGLGSFELQSIDAGHTKVSWTYSFKLRDDTFPGSFGGLGQWLFNKTFMEGDYADMMAVSAKAMAEYFR